MISYAMPSTPTWRPLEVGVFITGLSFLALYGADLWIIIVFLGVVWLSVKWQISRSKHLKTLMLMGCVAAIVAAGSLFAKTMYWNLEYPNASNGRSEWDFLAFWVDGRVGISGEDFYDSQSYLELNLPVQPSTDFRKSILSVGFRYPPISMLLFAPLGLFSYSAAYALWYVVNSVALGFAILLVWRRYFKRYHLQGLVVAALILLAMRGAFATVRAGQSNFLVLLALVAFVADMNRLRGGFWLGFGIVVKPLLLILLLPLGLKKNWRAVGGALIALACACLLTVVFFGIDAFSGYVGTLPSKMPYSSYVEEVRQSLLAGIMRIIGTQSPPPDNPALNPVFVGASLMMVLLSAWATLRLPKEQCRLAFGYWIPLMMVVYPGTLYHYSVYLAVPFLLLWQARKNIRNWNILFLAMSTLVYYEASTKASNSVLLASIGCWLLALIAQKSLTNKVIETL